LGPGTRGSPPRFGLYPQAQEVSPPRLPPGLSALEHRPVGAVPELDRRISDALFFSEPPCPSAVTTARPPPPRRCSGSPKPRQYVSVRESGRTPFFLLVAGALPCLRSSPNLYWPRTDVFFATSSAVQWGRGLEAPFFVFSRALCGTAVGPRGRRGLHRHQRGAAIRVVFCTMFADRARVVVVEVPRGPRPMPKLPRRR